MVPMLHFDGKLNKNNKRTPVLTLVAMVTPSSHNPFYFSLQITKFALLPHRFLKKIII